MTGVQTCALPISPETPVSGRPLANLSLAANYAAGEIAPFGYHVTNLAIVIGAAVVLLGIVRRTLDQLPDSEYRGLHQAAAGLSLYAALWWLLHPLLSETVGYVTQRTESMMGLCLLLTLYASIRAGTGTGRLGWSIAAVAACAAGMATKESMVVAPVVVVLYDLAYRDGSISERTMGRRGLYAALAACWVLLALLMAGSQRTTVGLSTNVGPGMYALNQLQALARYAWLTVWPRNLVLDYGLPRILAPAMVLGPALVVAILIIGTVVLLLRQIGRAHV